MNSLSLIHLQADSGSRIGSGQERKSKSGRPLSHAKLYDNSYCGHANDAFLLLISWDHLTGNYVQVLKLTEFVKY